MTLAPAALFELFPSYSFGIPVKYARSVSTLGIEVVTLTVSRRLSVAPVFNVSMLHRCVAWS